MSGSNDPSIKATVPVNTVTAAAINGTGIGNNEKTNAGNGHSPDLSSLGYFLLPIPAGRKEPPPVGWVNQNEPYHIPTKGNVAIAARGDVAILISNDAAATNWAAKQFGEPNVRTPRGGHWYFRARPGQANEANKVTTVGAMELHVWNKYAVVPPSVHPSGVEYRWERPLPPVAELTEAPDFRDLWHPHGTHHAQLLRISAAKAHSGLDPQTIAAELTVWRDDHLPDPEAHPDRELIGMAESACQKFSHPEARPSVGRDLPALFCVIEHQRSGRPDEKLPNRAAFEAALTQEFRFATPRDSQQLLICREGVYVLADTYVAAWIQLRCEEEGVPASLHFVSEVLGSLRRQSYRDREEIDPSRYLPLNNGYYDVNDGSFHLYDASGEPVFTYRLTVPFLAGAECPKFEKAIAYIFPGEAERVAFQQFCGYIIEPSQKHKVGCVVLGAPNIGKTAVLETIMATFGDIVTTAISLRELCESRFAAWPLVGMLVSICPDLAYAPIEHTGLYKQITGGDRVKVEPKGGRPYQAALRVKFLFGANVLPRIKTTDDTVFNRFLVLSSTAKTIPRAERDLRFGSKLAAEAPGILQWMIRGRHLLEQAGGFDSVLLERSERLWMESSDPVRAFVEARVVASPLVRTGRADVLAGLEDWIETKGLTPFDMDPSKRVAAIIRAKFPSVAEEKDSSSRWWVGIELVEEVCGSNGRKSTSQEPGKKIGALDGLDYVSGSALSSEFAAIRATAGPGSTPTADAGSRPAEEGSWQEGPVKSLPDERGKEARR